MPVSGVRTSTACAVKGFQPGSAVRTIANAKRTQVRFPIRGPWFRDSGPDLARAPPRAVRGRCGWVMQASNWTSRSLSVTNEQPPARGIVHRSRGCHKAAGRRAPAPDHRNASRDSYRLKRWDRSLPPARLPAPLDLAAGEARNPDHRDLCDRRAQPERDHMERLFARPA
jgi:hypothetical protein